MAYSYLKCNRYKDNISIIVVNNVPGACIPNSRGSIRQGDKPSMSIFAYGIDPLLVYLDRRLKGILITSIPVHGPVKFLMPPLKPLEERYKVLGYADDVKPAITEMREFLLVDKGLGYFEKASGCKMHAGNHQGCLWHDIYMYIDNRVEHFSSKG